MYALAASCGGWGTSACADCAGATKPRVKATVKTIDKPVEANMVRVLELSPHPIN